MSKDQSSLFDELLSNYIKTIETNCLDQLKKAKNKTAIQDKILNQVRAMTRCYNRALTKHNATFNYFVEKYNAGETIDDIIGKINAKHPQAMKMAPEKDEREDVDLIPFGKEEEFLLSEFPKENQKIVTFYIGYLALTEITKRIPDYLNKEAKIPMTKRGLKWTAPKETKNEFVQLVYGLHQAGFINNGTGEVTKITETLAEVFGLDLGKNWQSNHSASIHKANSDYDPQVFDKVKQAYIRYTSTQRENKKKK